MDKKKNLSIRNMVFTALFAAVICVLAPFSITIGPVPLTFATLAIYLAASTLDWKLGTAAVIVYIALGAFGLPVFSSFSGGLQKIAGATGGYIIGYIPLALATGLIIKTFKNRIWSFAFGMVIGTVLLYTCGTIWFMYVMECSLATALGLCVVPFLIGDVIKIILVCLLAPPLRAALKKQAER